MKVKLTKDVMMGGVIRLSGEIIDVNPDMATALAKVKSAIVLDKFPDLKFEKPKKTVDLSKKTVKELRKMLDSAGVEYKHSMSKKSLIGLIESSILQ